MLVKHNGITTTPGVSSCQKVEIDISCRIFESTLKCTSSPHTPLIGHSKMKLTDVDFSFPKFHWLLENNEADQADCLTAFGYFKGMNNFFSIFKLHLDDCFELSVSCLCQLILRCLELVNCYAGICAAVSTYVYIF